MQANNIFSKIIRRANKLIYRFIRFGVSVTFFDYLFEITQSDKISKIKHKIVVNYLKRKYSFFVSERLEKVNIPPQGKIPKQIWVCWWNGIDMMPPLVKTCYESILRYSNGYQVTLITKYNYTDYFTVPDYIIEKINNGTLHLTQFSEIVRLALLYNHGGLWLDATYLITNPIEIQEIPFFTIRTYYDAPKHIANGRWQGNCIGGVPKYYFFCFLLDFLVEYWRDYNYLLTYHLYDYAINLTYDSFPSVKASFDNINPINKNDFLVDNLINEYDGSLYEKAVKDTIFHKLSWKRVGPTRLSEDKLTFYGYILSKFQ